jgi:hypothetical protein
VDVHVHGPVRAGAAGHAAQRCPRDRMDLLFCAPAGRSLHAGADLQRTSDGTVDLVDLKVFPASVPGRRDQQEGRATTGERQRQRPGSGAPGRVRSMVAVILRLASERHVIQWRRSPLLIVGWGVIDSASAVSAAPPVPDRHDDREDQHGKEDEEDEKHAYSMATYEVEGDAEVMCYHVNVVHECPRHP